MLTVARELHTTIQDILTCRLNSILLFIFPMTTEFASFLAVISSYGDFFRRSGPGGGRAGSGRRRAGLRVRAGEPRGGYRRRMDSR